MRSDRQRLDDVLAAAAAIESHLEHGALADGIVFAAVERLRNAVDDPDRQER